jgi:hypothetical protein
MDVHDIDKGAPPQTHGSGRRRSSTWLWGAANPPRPRPKGRAGHAWLGGGGQVRPDLGQPLTGRPQALPVPVGGGLRHRVP